VTISLRARLRNPRRRERDGALLRVAGRVGHAVHQSLPDLGAVASQAAEAFGRCHEDAVSVSLAQRAHGGGGLLEKGREGKVRDLERDVARLDVGEIQRR
jgi:hypothetical protein